MQLTLSVLAQLRYLTMTAFLRTNCSVVRPSFSTKQQISTLFLQLPPSCRTFHASPQPRFLDAAITSTHTLLEGLHSFTGLPWAYTLPLSALAIRTAFVLPFSIYSRRAAQKQATLTPLVMSWQHQLRKETMREVGHLGPGVAHSTLLKKTRKKRNEIYSRWGCGRWKMFLPIIQVPIWLTAIETIRKMCGTSTGLLGMIAATFTSGKDAAGLEDSAIITGVETELSFATEGALWFQDLLLPDPQMILPFMLSGTILLNLTHAAPRGMKMSTFQRRLSNSLKIVGLVIGPLILHVPSAMLVYWISSSMLAYTQALVLDRVMPVKPPNVAPKTRNQSGLGSYGPDEKM